MYRLSRHLIVGLPLVLIVSVAGLLTLSEGGARGAGPSSTPIATVTAAPGAAARGPSAGTPAASTSASAGAIARFTDAGWGNTAVDGSGAVVIAGSQLGVPSWLQHTFPSDRVPHRSGFYQLQVVAPVPITHYAVKWTNDTPPGSQIKLFTDAEDYHSAPPGQSASINLSGTSANVTLAKPSKRVGVTFELVSGIGAAASDPGASPRLTTVSIVSPDSSALTVTPLFPPVGSSSGNQVTVTHGSPPIVGTPVAGGTSPSAVPSAPGNAAP